MEIIFKVLLFFTICSGFIEAALKTLERIYVGIRGLMIKGKEPKAKRGQALTEWCPINKFLMVVFSIALVFVVNISLVRSTRSGWLRQRPTEESLPLDGWVLFSRAL
jgi:hypothetical protein